MGELFFSGVVLLLVLAPFIAHCYKIRRQRRTQQTIKKLCMLLFPGDLTGSFRNNVVEDLMVLTKRRFSEDEVLDYYLKIKGLQLVDINSFNDYDLCEFLMRPTEIHLNYSELVSFYEKYLDQQQATGINAVGE